MTFIKRHRVLIAGVVLVALTNIVVISGALGNRSGEPEAVLTLTERELSLNNWRKENSGLSLQLNWAGNYDVFGNDWLDGDKLAELGFEPPDPQDREAAMKYIEKALPRLAYIVLEFDGPAYQSAVQVAEATLAEETALLAGDPDNETQQARHANAERQLALLHTRSSRLYPVDAGPDPASLRQRYPDNTRYIIAGGRIRPGYRGYREAGVPYRGFIQQLDVTKIHVPLEHRAVFDALPERQFDEDGYTGPRYRVELAYGSRLEPWVRGAVLIGDGSPGE